MAATAVGKTVFLNHKYMVPEDVFGSITKADVVQRGEVWDLDFTIDVEDENPRAARTHSSILRGVQLGTSVGAIVKDAWKERDRVVIDDVDLLEASIVGIPANPRSFVQYAVKALHEAEEALEAEEAEEAEVVEKSVDEPPAESTDSDNQAEVSTETETPAEAPEAQEGEEPAPDSQEGDAPAEEATKSISATTTPKVDWNRVDDGDLVGDEAKALLSMKQADFTTLLRMVESTTGELVETKKALWDAQKGQAEAERERDEANANVELAKQFVQKLSELPIGRRASHAAVIGDFEEKFSGIYDPDFIKMLTSGES
jgi:HK97 family phage prohead protease